MRYRVGRILRLIAAIAFLVFVTPFFLSKFDFGNEGTIVDDTKSSDSNVNNQKFLYLLIN